MVQRKKLNLYQKGMELAESCNYQQALACIQEYLCTVPDDAKAMNDAGAILYCLGRCDEAIEHFVKARSLQCGSVEILWNLAEAYLGAGRTNEAARLFDEMQQMGILSSELLNKAANAFLARDNKAGDIEMLQKSLQIDPDQKILEPMIEVIRSRMPKVTFFCGDNGTSFVEESAEFIKQRFGVNIVEKPKKEDLYELMESSDISWFEPGSLAVTASMLPKLCKNIIRVDCYDTCKQWPRQVNWINIDILVAIGKNVVRDALVQKIPGLESQTSIANIPTGVNLEKFAFANRHRGKNIAFLSNLSLLKNPAFVLQCMQKLHYIDPEYRLFFSGEFMDLALEQYLKYMVNALGLRDVVFFDPPAAKQENVSRWFEDKHYIVSTSVIEGQCRELLEGMARGLKPVIHNFPGADQVFPSEFLFNISEEFCEQILSDKYEPHRYRRFVEENYSLENQLTKISDVFRQLESTNKCCKSAPGTRIEEYRIPVMSPPKLGHKSRDHEALKKGF
jgi:pentatricopeptide repeat protein